MENKNNTLVVVLVFLIIGLFAGYVFGTNSMSKNLSFMSGEYMDEMHDEYKDDHENSSVDDHMDEEIVAEDGLMQHVMEEMMRELRGKTGVEYEEAFLKGMIVHHIGAVDMAEQLLENTERPELVAMANNIISAQSTEIDQMKAWLNEWFN
jgi:uncharacterized protein (DUF305 family)